MIYIQLTNGFGNNLFQYIAGRLLATFHEQEVVVMPPTQDYYGISEFKKIGINVQNAEVPKCENVNDINYTHYFNPKYKNNDFLDSACLIKLVDLVITCDTSICHLSGALNTKTWVLLRKNPDWRWYDVNNVWYNNLKIFKQKEFFNWKTVFDDVYNNLINEYKL